MTLLALALLCVTPPPAATVAKAEAMVKDKQWEELYLAFATATPASYAKGDLPRLAKALSTGCAALLADDAVLANSLGEKSVVFEPTAEGLYCTGLSGLRTDQRAAAETSFREGMAKFPKDLRFPLELGRLFAAEGDEAGARGVLAKIPKKAPEWADAQAVLKQLTSPKQKDPGGAERNAGDEPPAPRKSGRPTPDDEAPRPSPGDQIGHGPPPSTGTMGYESSVDSEGRRVRANQYFRFRYFSNQKDFGQRAEFEGTVQAALETAREAAERVLGVARKTPTDVVLYSRAEFELHHGPQYAQRIAGFYSESAIRMNDTAEITPQNQAVLVHEYTHAVIDELASFHPHPNVPIWLNEGLAEYTEWQFQGHDGASGRVATALKQQANNGTLPSLATMANEALVNTSNPQLAYAYSASAVKVLVHKHGIAEVIALIRECGRGKTFAAALQEHYNQDLADLDAEVVNDLKG
jgi:hypothetical protein